MWVCSKWNENPKDEEKWEVLPHDSAMYWRVKNRFDDNGLGVWLPKSDYRPCDPPQPPERWVDVSEQCDFGLGSGDVIPFQHFPYQLKCNTLFEWPRLAKLEGYRLRKVQLYKSLDGNEVCDDQWAFVVEKNESAKFLKTNCSQCGKEFGPGNSGYSHCDEHLSS